MLAALMPSAGQLQSRRWFVPSRCAAGASRKDAMAAETASTGWLHSQLLTAPS
jgi:hypothetical protein